MGTGEDSDGVGSDFVGYVAVGSDAVGTDKDDADTTLAHKGTGHVVSDERQWNARMLKLPCGQACAWSFFPALWAS